MSRGKKGTIWLLYILKCADNTLYAGVTTDIKRRLREHNTGKGGNYTRVRLPVTILYEEFHPNRSEAQKREAQIKSLSRQEKMVFITRRARRRDRKVRV